MILSGVEEVLTAQSYILFYHHVTPSSMSRPPSLKSVGTSDTEVYSLWSMDTISMSDTGDDEKSNSVMSGGHIRGSSLSKPPSLSSIESIPTLKGSDTMPVLSTFSSSTSCSKTLSSSDKKYSLKADGTEVLLDEDSIDGSNPLLLENTIQIIDGEISFNFKNSLEFRKESTGNASKCSSELFSGDSMHAEPKKTRKLSFGPSSFYSSQKDTLSHDGSQSNSSFVQSSSSNQNQGNRRSLPNTRLNTANVEKLERLVEKRSKEEVETGSPKHVKRRKSTFW